MAENLLDLYGTNRKVSIYLQPLLMTRLLPIKKGYYFLIFGSLYMIDISFMLSHSNNDNVQDFCFVLFCTLSTKVV